VRLVWITMLAMSDRDGCVEASVPGLASAARVTRAEADDAISVLLSPDPDSRTPDHEGRRIEAIDGGWRLLNHGKYRARMSADEQREKARIRMAAKRAKAKAAPAEPPECSRGVTIRYAMFDKQKQIPEADPKAETRGEIPREAPPGDGEFLILVGFQQRWQAHEHLGRKLGDMWPGVGTHMPKVQRWAAWAAADPVRLSASLAGYFACRDPFVIKVRWNLATWLADPERYLANDPGDAAAFGHTGVRYLTDEEVLGGE
jgi:hypothetical protein